MVGISSEELVDNRDMDCIDEKRPLYITIDFDTPVKCQLMFHFNFHVLSKTLIRNALRSNPLVLCQSVELEDRQVPKVPPHPQHMPSFSQLSLHSAMQQIMRLLFPHRYNFS